jgi:hypothetical protein
MMTGDITLSYFHDTAAGGANPRASANSILGLAADRRYYGSIAFADIHHNWNLTNKNSLIAHLVDIRAIPDAYTIDSRPKIYGLDENTVRIMLTNVNNKVADLGSGTTASITTVNGSTTVTMSTTGLVVGQTLVCPTLLSEHTRITAIGAGSVTVNQVAIADGTASATIRYWRPNENTLTGKTPTDAYGFTVPKYRYTLLEYTD